MITSITKFCEEKIKEHNKLASKFQVEDNTYNFATHYGYMSAYKEVVDEIKKIKEQKEEK